MMKRSKIKEPERYQECIKRREYWKNKLDNSKTLEEMDKAHEEYIKACNDCSDFD